VSARAALPTAVLLVVLATAACTAGPAPEPTGDATTATSTADAAPPARGTDGTPDASGDETSPGATPGASDRTTPAAPDGPPSPEVRSLADLPTAAPLVPRPGWQVVAGTGACVQSWRGAVGTDAPTTTPREASVGLLEQVAAEDGADPVGVPGDVLLPLGGDGVRLHGVNGVVQSWTVATARGDVHVRGAARVVRVPTFGGEDSTQSVVIVLDCVGSLDEAAWKGLLEDVRVGLVAPVEEPGVWPS